MELPFSESFRIKMVETIRKSTREEREQWIKEAKYNLFNLKSDQVFIDLLTDSGTGAMSDKQWAELMLGDESYAGARSYYKMKNAIKEILGFDYRLTRYVLRRMFYILPLSKKEMCCRAIPISIPRKDILNSGKLWLSIVPSMKQLIRSWKFRLKATWILPSWRKY